jgi:amidase
LTVHIHQVLPDRSLGWSYSTPAPTVVEPIHFATIPDRRMIGWTIDLEHSSARLTEPTPDLINLMVSINPMIGCIGVAPDLSQAITSYASGSFGGNMDCPLITSGCTMEFPVFVSGGLFFVGDMHAAQSHGEITSAAIEVSGSVRFTVKVLKNKSVFWPRGETTDLVFTVGSGRPLELAMQHATSEMIRLLEEKYHLPYESACVVMSQSVKYLVSNAVNEKFTIACILPKSILLSLKA